MKKTERNLLIAVSLALVLLFILSSTDLVLAEKKNEVYVISVLVDDDSSKSWHNFRMGMDKAAEKWNADVSFVTLYDKGSSLQQAQLLEREVENGAGAIILSPANSQTLTAALDDIPVSIPIITVGAGVDSPRVRSVITAAPDVMGAELGARIATDHKTKSFSQIIEVTYRQERTDGDLLSDSLRRAIPDGLPLRKVIVRTPDELDAFITQLETIVTPTVVAATDADTLLAISEELEAVNVNNLTLYGVGWSGGLLRHVESGSISHVGVYSDYDMGYLSVEAAIRSLTGEPVAKQYRVGQALIAQADIHSKAYEMMLFPIV